MAARSLVLAPGAGEPERKKFNHWITCSNVCPRTPSDTLAHHHIASLTEDQKARAKGLLESSGALSAHSTTHPSSHN